MLFNSFSFLASFGAFAILYYVVPRPIRWVFLLIASVGFYATFDVRYVPLLAGVTAIAYLAGLAIDAADGERRRRRLLILGSALVLSALVAFKYLDFLSQSLSPLFGALGVGAVAPARLNVVAVAGLSFYTFSCLSYIADVYARRIPVERHVGFFALYVGYFPKILAGPIERAQPFLTAVRRGATFDDRLVTSGLQLMLWGLFKKVVIADRLAIFVDAAYARPGFAPPADLLLATYFFAFQLYCDFSGYSDIAIGVSRVLGIDLMDNFRRPYLSSSVSEFWARRWHLSLTAWFRDYVYFPLGGSRRSAVRTVVNVMIVFLLSGLWHGAAWTFVVWGALNGVFTVATTSASRIGRRWPASLRLRGPVRTLTASLVTFHLILITWVFFRAATLADAVTVFTRIAASATALPSLLAVRLATGEVMTAVVLIAVLLGIEILDERRDIWQRLERKPVGLRWAAYYALLGALVVLGTWNFEQFVYMQF